MHEHTQSLIDNEVIMNYIYTFGQLARLVGGTSFKGYNIIVKSMKCCRVTTAMILLVIVVLC